MSLASNIQKLTNRLAKSPGFSKVLDGMRFVSAEPGKVIFEMEVKQEHLNADGTLHGGLLCTLVDNVSTLAIGTTKDNLGVSVDLNISFIAAAAFGENMVIESEVLRSGKNLAYANVNIFNKGDGKLVATGRHTKYLAAGAKLSDFQLCADSDT